MDSRTRLLNAPQAQRRVVALLLPIAAAALLLVVAFGASASLAARATGLADKRERLGQLEAIAASMPAAAGVPALDAGAGPEFLAGDNDSLIQAAIQTRFREMAAASGAEVLAVGNTPIMLRGDARFAGLRTTLSGSNDAIVQTIFAVETSRPYMTIRSASINSGSGYGDDGSGGPQQLMLQMQFEGALPTDGEASPAAADVPGVAE
jgi:hypothetical protein